MTRKTGFADVGGTRLYYELMGQGPALVLVHGGLLDRSMWDGQFTPFAEYYTVVRYDVRGYGQSALGHQPYSDIEDLYHLLQWLHLDHASVLGISMGEEIVRYFTLEHPERVGALLLVSPGVDGYGMREPLKQQIATFVALARQGERTQAIELFSEMWVNGPDRQADAAVLQRAQGIMDGYSFGHFSPSAPENSYPDPESITRLSAIHVPTLIVAGASDQPSVLASADLLEAEIAGASKVMLSGAAHLVPMEQPEAFNRVVLDFLNHLA
jgi:3-oxoadipate enol-lactonase